MKYIFVVNDGAKEKLNLYSIEADNLETARNELTKKFMPYFTVTYDEMVSGLNDMEIYIEEVEADSKIIEL